VELKLIIDNNHFIDSLNIRYEYVYKDKYNCINTNETILKKLLYYDLKLINNGTKTIKINNEKIKLILKDNDDIKIKNSVVNLNYARDSWCYNINNMKIFNIMNKQISPKCWFIKTKDIYSECQFIDVTDIDQTKVNITLNYNNEITEHTIDIEELPRYSNRSWFEKILIIILIPLITISLIILNYVFTIIKYKLK